MSGPRSALSAIVALVPVKDLGTAKSRLAARLSASERADLVLGCLDRVLTTLRRSDCIDLVGVVSESPTVLSRAEAAGARALDERRLGLGSGHNEALEGARGFVLRRAGIGSWENGERSRSPDVSGIGEVSALLVVSVDLPYLTEGDVQAMIGLGQNDRTVVIAPDRRGEGTNALFLRPADAIPFRFGPGSRRAHAALAATAGLEIREYHASGTALDVDLPSDLPEAVGPETGRREATTSGGPNREEDRHG